MGRRTGFAILALASTQAVVAQPAGAQSGPDYVRENYQKQEVLIPMRDGVRLFTSIYRPKNLTRPAPILMQRTPYSVRPYGEGVRGALGPEVGFTRQGYIFVYQDVRGRYMSEGDFQWMTPYKPNKKPGEVDESTDTHDTIEWLIRNVSGNNGRVGVYGTSFPGHYAAQALIDPHPALKAAAPQAPMADNWLGDDMHHNGAFFLPHAMNFIAGFGVPRTGPTQQYGPRAFTHGTQDGYKFFLEMGPIKNSLTKHNMDRIPLWKEWISNPDFNEYWQAQNVPQHLKNVGDVAVLTVGGWYDAEDLYGPLAIYKSIERYQRRNRSTLVMGPWYHGTWNGGPGTNLHDIAWTTRTGDDYRQSMQDPFFREHLWQDGKANLAEAAVFDLGADRWNRFSEWPPRKAKPLDLFLTPDRGLSVGKKPKSDTHSYVSDPANPVPYSASAHSTVGMARNYMLEDQRFLAGRPDVLSYVGEPLEAPLTLAGPLVATLHVSTTGTDADFVVKLIDVFPDDYSTPSPRGPQVQMGGYQKMVRGEPMRARYRRSWSKSEPFVPGKTEKVEFVLPDMMHTFRKGHRIMVQIHSTWFPLVDRNPQTFVPSIFFADEKDFQAQTHTIHLGGRHASKLRVTRLP